MNKYDPRHDWALRHIAYHDWMPKNMSEKQCSKLNMLRPLRAACKSCTMCNLGVIDHTHLGERIEDYRVFSNMRPSRFVVIGQNPGYNECVQDEPFVGDAGTIFNNEITKHGIDRSMFYITNVVKCHTPDNRKPERDEIEACKPFIMMELKLLKPILVITLGAVAFQVLCPDRQYSDSLGKVVQSTFGVNVYPIYHPSPRNMQHPERRAKFDSDIAALCALIKKLGLAARQDQQSSCSTKS
ncbi:MAG: uracil-DNA glycosylase [Candidatus Nitrosocaldus sp.]